MGTRTLFIIEYCTWQCVLFNWHREYHEFVIQNTDSSIIIMIIIIISSLQRLFATLCVNKISMKLLKIALIHNENLCACYILVFRNWPSTHFASLSLSLSWFLCVLLMTCVYVCVFFFRLFVCNLRHWIFMSFVCLFCVYHFDNWR